MAHTHALHKGELLLQKLRHTPGELTDIIPNYIYRDMPEQHAEFFTDLSYLPLGTLDSQGRPWASLLVTKSNEDSSVGIVVIDHNQTDIVAETNPFDPFVRALGEEQTTLPNDKRLFAGVGIDFTNRRRNKLAGSIKPISIEPAGKISVQLKTDQHLGNCPKYITVRSLEYNARNGEIILDSFEELTSPLPEIAKVCIERASTTYLATKHIAEHENFSDDQRDMGLNHRGGTPGFIRLYEEKDGDTITTYLVLPDHSGNRFYQSLGNIETNKQVGMIFPDFTSGDVLYITGNAENLHDAEAEAIMPRAGLLTRIQVTGAVFVKAGLNLKLTSDEQYSPYNPPVKYLRSELEEMGHTTAATTTSEPIKATLVSTQVHSERISTFTFDLSSPVEQGLPGGFGVFDFSGILDIGYRHMDEINPQMVNEDYIRTWTLSSAPEFDAEKNAFLPTNQVSITVKRKPDGLMSSFLHEHADKLIDRKLQINLRGTGAGFSCFTPCAQGGPPNIPSKMLWIAGGVGITPFMAMWAGLIDLANALPEYVSTDIVMIFSGRDDDINLLNYFLAQSSLRPENLKIHILAFQSVGKNSSVVQSAQDTLQEDFSDAALKIEQRRALITDIEIIEDLTSRDVFLCGPTALMRWSREVFKTLGLDQSKLHQESFSF